jgi:septum formation protein
MSRPIVLASSSPRRAALLAAAGIAFERIAPAVDEEALGDGIASPSARAMALARAKARAVHALRPDALVLGADTLVVLDGSVLGKPAGAAQALAMLSRLSGRAHEVVTGLALVGGGPDGTREDVTFVATAVQFRRWPAAALAAYAASGEPLDKAGAYGIQGPAGAWVERIEGDFTNVVGLPVPRVVALLARAAGEDPA